MSAVAAPAVTPDDLLRMPDEGRGFELVDGELRGTEVSNESSFVGGQVLYAVMDHVRPRGLGYVFMADNSFRCFPDDPDRVRRADVSFVSAARMTPAQYRQKGHCPICPDLVVEVVSPNDLMSDVTEKRMEWLAAGVGLVWVVDPVDESVYAFHGGAAKVFRDGDTLTAEPVLPGFAVPVADLFQLPGS